MTETRNNAISTPGTAEPRQRQGKLAGQRRASPRGLWLLALALGLLVLVVGGTWYGFSLGISLYRGDRILPGVHVWGIDLGGQTRSEAAKTLANEWGRRAIVLEGGEASWSLPPDKLGIVLDADATAQAAYAEWRSEQNPDQPRQTARQLIASYAVQNQALQRILRRLDPTLAAPKRVEVKPVWHFDPDIATGTLRTVAGQLEISPQDAAVKVVGGSVEATEAVTGQGLDISASLGELEALADDVARAPAPAANSAGLGTAATSQPAPRNSAAPREESARLRLAIVPLVPAITDLGTVVEETSRLLTNPITVRLWDPVTDERPTWTITPEEMSGWLSFRPAADAPSKIVWSINDSTISDTLSKKEAALGGGRYVDRQQAVPAIAEAFQTRKSEVRQRLLHFAKTHIVKSGETLASIGFDYGIPYPWILAANPGMDEKVAAGQQITIPSQDNLLPLPPVENKRIKISLSKQKMQAFENGAVKWEWPVSTGIKSSPTNPGVFQIQTHDPLAYAARWDLWMPQFMGIYRPVPSVDFMNGFHGFPSRNQRQILWTKNLGSPITYGCIMVSSENAKLLYDWADEGVVVEIVK